MSELTLESLNKYIETTASKREISISCGDSKLEIDLKALSNIEKINTLIDSVISETYLDIIKPNYFHRDLAFTRFFLKLFTNFPIPTKETENGVTIDIQATNDMVLALNIFNNIIMILEVKQLYDYVDKQIEFKNAELISSFADNEAIETVSYLANRTLDGVNKVCDVLDNLKDLTQNGKLLKVIPKKKLEVIFDGLQKIINNLILTLHPDSNGEKVINLKDIIAK